MLREEVFKGNLSEVVEGVLAIFWDNGTGSSAHSPHEKAKPLAAMLSTDNRCRFA